MPTAMCNVMMCMICHRTPTKPVLSAGAGQAQRLPMAMALAPAGGMVQVPAATHEGVMPAPQLVQHAIPMMVGSNGTPQWVWGAPSNVGEASSTPSNPISAQMSPSGS